MAQNGETARSTNPPPVLYHYVLGLLRRPPESSRPLPEEAERLQAQHLGHLQDLLRSGELLLAGPVEEDGELRGILIFRTASKAKALELMRPDPLVARRLLVLELYPWMTPTDLTGAGPESRAPNLTFDTD